MKGLSLLEEYEDLLQKLRVQTAEEYNINKISWDTEVQVNMDLMTRITTRIGMLLYILLRCNYTRYSNAIGTNKTLILCVSVCVQNIRKNVQEVKFTCHTKEETLHYKFETLKKREEENTILKSLLKRKIIRY